MPLVVVAPGVTWAPLARPRILAVVRRAAVLVLLCSSLAPRAAHANAPAPYRYDLAALGGAWVIGQTPLVVEREELDFTCGLVDLSPSCRFRAVYHVYNPTSAREQVLGAFYGIASEATSIRAAGVDVRRELTDEQAITMDASVRALGRETDPTLRPGEEPAPVSRTGFTLAVEPGARVDLAFDGPIRPTFAERADPGGGFLLPALTTRHPYVSSRDRNEASHEYRYALFPIKSWAGAPLVAVTVRFPSSWRFDSAGTIPWSRTSSGGETTARARLDPRAVATLRLPFTVPGATVLDGGPLAGIGGRLDVQELRARFGWEAGLSGGAAIGSLALETNFHSRATVVSLIEAALPNLMFLIPSLGAGVGVPVQWRSEGPALVGARIQLTMSFPLLSLVFPIDWYPAAPEGASAQTSLIAQVSF
jgi:hypothetical protein